MKIEKNNAGYKILHDTTCIEIQGTSAFEVGDTIIIIGQGGGSKDLRGFVIGPNTMTYSTDANGIQTNLIEGNPANSTYKAVITATQAGEKLRIFRLTGKNIYCKTIKVIRPGAEDPGPSTAINNTEDEVKAVKYFKDGQIFIEKNGHVYNAFGACIK